MKRTVALFLLALALTPALAAMMDAGGYKLMDAKMKLLELYALNLNDGTYTFYAQGYVTRTLEGTASTVTMTVIHSYTATVYVSNRTLYDIISTTQTATVIGRARVGMLGFPVTVIMTATWNLTLANGTATFYGNVSKIRTFTIAPRSTTTTSTETEVYDTVYATLTSANLNTTYTAYAYLGSEYEDWFYMNFMSELTNATGGIPAPALLVLLGGLLAAWRKRAA